MPRAIEFQRDPVVSMIGGLAARRDQIFYVVEAAIPKRARILRLSVRRVQNLAEIRSDQRFRALAVNVQDSLAKVRACEKCRPGVELRAHLSNRSRVATDDKHLRPDEHDHSALTAREGRERLRIHDAQFGRALRSRQGGSKMILQ